MTFEIFLRSVTSTGSFTNFTRSFTLAGEGRITSQLPFFLPNRNAITSDSASFEKLQIIPLGYREYVEFGTSGAFQKPKVFRIALFGLFAYPGEELRFGCILLKTLEFPKIVQLGSALAFGYRIVVKPVSFEDVPTPDPFVPPPNGPVFAPITPPRYGEDAQRGKYEDAHNILKQNDTLAHWFTLANNAWYFLSCSTEPGLLSFHEHAALAGFARIFGITEFNTDFYPFTQPIENPEEIIQKVAAIKNPEIQAWCRDRVNQLLVHQINEVRKLAALYVKASSTPS